MFVAKEDIIIITINVFIFIALFMDGILWDSIDSKKDPVTRRMGCQVFNNNYIFPSLKINTTFQCAVVVLLILSAVS